MVGWSTLTVGALVAAAAGSAVTVGVILTAGGPLANQDADGSTRRAEIATVVTTVSGSETPTSDPRASATVPRDSGEPYPYDKVLAASDEFDFGRLPGIDTSHWVDVVTPSGLVVFRVPPDWEVQVRTRTDADGNALGDSLNAWKPLGDVRPTEGGKNPGWLKLDAYTGAILGSYEPDDDQPLRRLALDHPAAGHTLEILQFEEFHDFPDMDGALSMYLTAAMPGPVVLNAVIHVYYPTTAQDVAVALAVIRSMELK
ncbi:MAG: hypothetical protein ACSLFM_03470 [Tepidiformaceae bacterium]